MWLTSGFLNNPGGTLMAAEHGSFFLQAERGINNIYGHLQGGGRVLALGGDAQLETQSVIVNSGGADRSEESFKCA